MVEQAGTGNGSNGLRGVHERIDRFERIIDAQNQNINQITADVAALASTVRTVLDNQKSLSSRSDRPLPWGAIIGGLSLIGICAGLLIAPIQRDVDELRVQTKDAEVHRRQDAYEMGTLEERTEWLMKLEEGRREIEHRGYGYERVR